MNDRLTRYNRYHLRPDLADPKYNVIFVAGRGVLNRNNLYRHDELLVLENFLASKNIYSNHEFINAYIHVALVVGVVGYRK